MLSRLSHHAFVRCDLCRSQAFWVGTAALLITTLAGCEGPQSALAPAGRGAEHIATLFWWMAGGALLTWSIVTGLAVYALRIAPQPHDERRAKLWIIGGGAIVPTVVLGALLVYGLALLPELLARPPAGSLQIEVVGLQWWWRVRYPSADAEPVELANEIRIPVGKPVEFLLSSADVIHSFWIPSLGGKVDMMPGRQTRLTLHPTKVGTYRGACAEYCGAAHAQMNFDVVVVRQVDFAAWLQQQRALAPTPSAPLATRGQQLFLANGCGACHSIRGTTADGSVGPDLTHVGSRLSLGASLLSNGVPQFHEWISRTDATKPGVLMPAFRMLPDADVRAIAAYLDGLE